MTGDALSAGSSGDWTGWVVCPLCPVSLPAWADRARWEHMDVMHRGSGPDYDLDWPTGTKDREPIGEGGGS